MTECFVEARDVCNRCNGTKGIPSPRWQKYDERIAAGLPQQRAIMEEFGYDAGAMFQRIGSVEWLRFMEKTHPRILPCGDKWGQHRHNYVFLHGLPLG